jgi:signal transduction histidine kinase
VVNIMNTAVFPYVVQSVITGDSPAWFITFCEDAGWKPAFSGYQSNTINQSSLKQALDNAHVLIGSDSQGTRGVFSRLINKPLWSRPVLVIVTNAPTSAEADLILPQSHSAVMRSLESMLSLRDLVLANSTDIASVRKARSAEAARQKRQQDEIELIKSAITHNVAHEFRTPLTLVRGGLDALHRDGNFTPELQRHLNAAREATTRLTEIFTHISMLASSLKTLKIIPMHPQDAVDQAVLEIKRKWHANEVYMRVSVVYRTPIALIEADRNALAMVLKLLLDNALTFTEREVQLIVEQCDGRMVFAVRDFGDGIPEHELEHIFSSYYQVERDTNRAHDGLGIGLTLVKRIIENHDTTITVVSERKKGSCFTFSLPLMSSISGDDEDTVAASSVRL